jgi:hypothetical protein
MPETQPRRPLLPSPYISFRPPVLQIAARGKQSHEAANVPGYDRRRKGPLTEDCQKFPVLGYAPVSAIAQSADVLVPSFEG